MSAYFIPIFFIIIMITALIKKVRPYDAFTTGAKSALPFATALFPFLAGIFILTELFDKSGLSIYLTNICAPFFSLFGIPKELTKLILIKPFSGNGSLAVLTEIFTEHGVDSYLARTASAIYGSSETVFYVASVYFASSKKKAPIKAIVISLVASFFSFVFACFICKII